MIHCFTDAHYRKSKDIYCRLVEHALDVLLDKICEYPRMQKPGNMAIYIGDFFNSNNATVDEIDFMLELFSEIAKTMDMVVMPGNHELGIRKCPLALSKYLDNVLYVDTISSMRVEDIRLIFVPFINDYQGMNFDDFIFYNLEGPLNRAEQKKDKVILFGHYPIGSPQVTDDFRYRDISHSLPFVEGIDLYCLGHIHRSQTLKVKGVPVIYPGAISKCRVDEKDNKNGWVKIFKKDNGKLDYVFNEIVSKDFVEVELTEELSAAEIKDKYGNKVVRLIVKDGKYDVARAVRKFEENCDVVATRREKKTKIELDRDLEFTSFNPVKALKDAVDKLEVSGKVKDSLIKHGESIITGAVND
jgi:DNA repair exonuclease SbcCD nuclease subunit